MLSICSSSCGKRPTWQTLPCSYKEAMGSARTAFPREAVMVLTGTLHPRGPDDVLDHGAPEVPFPHDPVGPELVIGGHREPAPFGRTKTCRAIGEHIAFAVAAEARNHDADLVRALALSAGGAGRVDRDHDERFRNGASILPTSGRAS